MDYVNCYHCNGTGLDNEAWNGHCFACNGSGQEAVDDRGDADNDPSDYGDDESL